MDYVMVARSRWHLKQAITRMYRTISSLNLVVHSNKKAIGRVEKGIHFLGIHFTLNVSLEQVLKP